MFICSEKLIEMAIAIHVLSTLNWMLLDVDIVVVGYRTFVYFLFMQDP